jgi:hypothetical protein
MNKRTELEIEKVACQITIAQMGYFANWKICDILQRRIDVLDSQLQHLQNEPSYINLVPHPWVRGY